MPLATAVERIQSKIVRARAHISALEVSIESFRRSRPLELGWRDSADGSERTFFLKTVPLVPIEIPLVAGDAIHNIRSSLDHLAYELVKVNGRNPTLDTCFPVFVSAQKFQSGAKRKIDGMSGPAKSAIEASQPYSVTGSLLQEIHQLDIDDKHHNLILTPCAFGEVYFVQAVGRVVIPGRGVEVTGGVSSVFFEEVWLEAGRDMLVLSRPFPDFVAPCIPVEIALTMGALNGVPVVEAARRMATCAENVLSSFKSLLV